MDEVKEVKLEDKVEVKEEVKGNVTNSKAMETILSSKLFEMIYINFPEDVFGIRPIHANIILRGEPSSKYYSISRNQSFDSVRVRSYKVVVINEPKDMIYSWLGNLILTTFELDQKTKKDFALEFDGMVSITGDFKDETRLYAYWSKDTMIITESLIVSNSPVFFPSEMVQVIKTKEEDKHLVLIREGSQGYMLQCSTVIRHNTDDRSTVELEEALKGLDKVGYFDPNFDEELIVLMKKQGFKPIAKRSLYLINEDYFHEYSSRGDNYSSYSPEEIQKLSLLTKYSLYSKGVRLLLNEEDKVEHLCSTSGVVLYSHDKLKPSPEIVGNVINVLLFGKK